MRLVYESYPPAAELPDNTGILPIHDACEGCTNIDVIKFMCKVAPASFSMKDKRGDVALHCAVCADFEVVKFVAEANPAAISTANNSLELPLHRACSLNVDINVISFLHESHEGGALSKTAEGHLPFHLGKEKFIVCKK